MALVAHQLLYSSSPPSMCLNSPSKHIAKSRCLVFLWVSLPTCMHSGLSLFPHAGLMLVASLNPVQIPHLLDFHSYTQGKNTLCPAFTTCAAEVP